MNGGAVKGCIQLYVNDISKIFHYPTGQKGSGYKHSSPYGLFKLSKGDTVHVSMSGSFYEPTSYCTSTYFQFHLVDVLWNNIETSRLKTHWFLCSVLYWKGQLLVFCLARVKERGECWTSENVQKMITWYSLSLNFQQVWITLHYIIENTLKIHSKILMSFLKFFISFFNLLFWIVFTSRCIQLSLFR